MKLAMYVDSDIENVMVPYRALLVAMLEQAIRDVRSKNPDIRRAAERWIWDDPFSVEVCQWLGYDHDALTEALEQPTVA